MDCHRDNAMELKAYAGIIYRRYWIVILATVMITILAFVASPLIKPVYQAQANLRALTPTGGTIGDVQYAVTYASRLTNTYAELASSASVMAELKQKLGLTQPPDVQVAIVPDSEIIQITAKAASPELAAKIANTLAGIVVVDSETPTSADTTDAQNLALLSDQLAAMDKDLTQARADYQALIGPYSQIAGELVVMNQTIAMKQQTYQSLQDKYQQAMISASSETYAPLKQQKNQTVDLLSQQITQLDTEMAGLKTTYQSLSTNSAELTEKLAAARQLVTLKEQDQSALLSQYATAQLGDARRSSPHTLVISSPAVAPTQPSGLTRPMIIILGAFFGFLVGIVLAFLVETLDTRMYSIEGIEKITNKSVVAQIPVLKKGQIGPQIVSDLIVQSSFWPLAARIITSHQTQGIKTVLMTSPGTKEGKSTIISILAECLSQSKQKVLVVDGDMRIPKQHLFFGLSNDFGLSNVLSGQTTLDEAINSHVRPGIDVLTAGPTPANITDLLHPLILGPIFVQMNEKYDLILIDSPCLLAVTDGGILAQIVDSVFLVVRYGQTTNEAIKSVNKLLADTQAHFLGVITTWAPRGDSRPYKSYYEKNQDKKGLPGYIPPRPEPSSSPMTSTK